jgi:NAD(P)-dependent dehydrogenase (short-subunit alcohol dehydrogenase family)
MAIVDPRLLVRKPMLWSPKFYPDTTRAKRGYGSIVNISSVATRNEVAVSTMRKGVAREFASLGICVNVDSPGTVDTSYHQRISTGQMLEAFKAATLVGRISSPTEIADTIVFLCSEAARFTRTGN